MKRIAVVVMAVGLFGAMPAFAEHAKTTMEQKSVTECALQAESIQQKIKRIQDEIKKGSTKYSVEDMKKLELKLKESNDILENLGKR